MALNNYYQWLYRVMLHTVPKLPKVLVCNKHELDIKGRWNIHLQKLATYNITQTTTNVMPLIVQ